MSELELVRLANGVRVALDPMPGLLTSALSVWQNVGARWERPEENGVAHLFEHMAFKGAGGRDAKKFAEEIEAIGGVLNAATGYEHTGYFARVVGIDTPFALDLIADILFAPHWEEVELDKEKSVVAQERGEAFDMPGDRVFELHQAALFPDQALGRPILGTAEVLDAMRIASLEQFRDAHLSPERVVVSVAGGYDRNAVLDGVERRFGNLKARPPASYAPAAPCAGVASEQRKSEQTHLVFSWPGPSAPSPDTRAASLFAEIFGGGMSSRLFQKIREERGLVYSIYATLDAYEDAGRLMVSASCAAKDAAEVARTVLAELEAFAAHGPTDAELKRAKAVAGAGLLMSAEAPSARAEARALQVTLRDRLIPFEEMKARTDAVEADAIRDLARAALEGPACAAAVGPKSGLNAIAAFQKLAI